MASMTKEPTTGEVPGNAIDSHHSHASAPFLRLPPELRNRIYKYALRLENGICEVNETTGFPEPALLFTCKDIRREAIAVFYSVNTIRLVIESYSPSMPIFMHKKRLAVLTRYGYKIPAAEASMEGLARWRNLLSWLRHVHENACTSLTSIKPAPPLGIRGHIREAPDYDKEKTVVAGLFSMVETMSEVPWDRVEKSLGMLRYGLVQYDSEWEVD
jgi:hypothetical protein